MTMFITRRDALVEALYAISTPSAKRHCADIQTFWPVLRSTSRTIAFLWLEPTDPLHGSLATRLVASKLELP